MARPTEDEFFEAGPAMRPCHSLLFIEALGPCDELAGGATASLSGAARRAVTRCDANIVETITVVNGAIRTWLYTSSEGVVSQHKHYDKTTIMTAWKQHGMYICSLARSRGAAEVRHQAKPTHCHLHHPPRCSPCHVATPVAADCHRAAE